VGDTKDKYNEKDGDDRNSGETCDVVVGGSAGRFNPQAGVEPTVVYTGPREQAKKTFKEYTANAAGGRWEWVHLRRGGNVVDTWPKDST